MSEVANTLDAVRVLVRRYVVMSDEQAIAEALWIFHSHCVDSFELSPYLAISSAEKRSGKTTNMKLLEMLVARPWRVVTPSEAVVYRKINRDRPTVLLDEYDTIFKDREYEPLRALLNAGNEPGTMVPRCAGANRDQLVDFQIYSAKALAGIGKLPDTIADRTIEIRLKRKKAAEQAERFRRREVRGAAEPVYQALVALAAYHADELADARPDLPSALDDRAADQWEALLSISDLAGRHWPAEARHAALVLSAGEARDDDSSGVVLLRDMRTIFDRRGVGRLASTVLCDDLHEIEESPWSEWFGRPITPRGVAKILARYDIEPKPFRFAEQTLRGYERDWFEDAWARHLADLSATPQQRASEQDFSSETIRNTKGDVADPKAVTKAHECSDVADVAITNGERALTAEDWEALREEIERRRREKLAHQGAERAAEAEGLITDESAEDTAEADHWAERIRSLQVRGEL